MKRYKILKDDEEVLSEAESSGSDEFREMLKNKDDILN